MLFYLIFYATQQLILKSKRFGIQVLGDFILQMTFQAALFFVQEDVGGGGTREEEALDGDPVVHVLWDWKQTCFENGHQYAHHAAQGAHRLWQAVYFSYVVFLEWWEVEICLHQKLCFFLSYLRSCSQRSHLVKWAGIRCLAYAEPAIVCEVFDFGQISIEYVNFIIAEQWLHPQLLCLVEELVVHVPHHQIILNDPSMHRCILYKFCDFALGLAVIIILSWIDAPFDTHRQMLIVEFAVLVEEIYFVNILGVQAKKREAFPRIEQLARSVGIAKVLWSTLDSRIIRPLEYVIVICYVFHVPVLYCLVEWDIDILINSILEQKWILFSNGFLENEKYLNAHLI